MQSAVMPQYVVCLSLCPSVCSVGGFTGLWSQWLEFF